MSRQPLNLSSGMPQVGIAFAGWAKKITIYKRIQVIMDELVTYEGGSSEWDDGGDWDILGQTWDQAPAPLTAITFTGTIQPLSAKSLALKPDGQRSWTWLQIHCFSGPMNLNTNDIIIYNQNSYKVMALLDYSLNNYIEYHLVKDYQDNAPDEG